MAGSMTGRTENATSPVLTVGEVACAVRRRPYTDHGCRPISAVIHPAVLAMYGNGIESRRIQSIQRAPLYLRIACVCEPLQNRQGRAIFQPYQRGNCRFNIGFPG